MENSPRPVADTLDIRIAIDTELRRLGWHWRHDRIQAWLGRVSQATGKPKSMVCDLSLKEMEVLLRNLRSIPKQLELTENAEKI